MFPDTIALPKLPQFRHSPYLLRMLEAMQAHRQADGYELEIRPVPDLSNIDVAANATFEGRVTVPNGSYLYAMSGSSSQAAGFDANVRNAGNQQDLGAKRVNFTNLTGQGGGTPSSPLFYLPRPLLFLEPAQILVQIWNKASATNTIQLCLWLYCPEVSRRDY